MPIPQFQDSPTKTQRCNCTCNNGNYLLDLIDQPEPINISSSLNYELDTAVNNNSAGDEAVLPSWSAWLIVFSLFAIVLVIFKVERQCCRTSPIFYENDRNDKNGKNVNLSDKGENTREIEKSKDGSGNENGHLETKTCGQDHEMALKRHNSRKMEMQSFGGC